MFNSNLHKTQDPWEKRQNSLDEQPPPLTDSPLGSTLASAVHPDAAKILAHFAEPGETHKHAGRGVCGPGTQLPYHEQIQQAFGHHDIDDIQAYIGGNANQACTDIGAQAYAFGDRVAFGSSPSLHTAAHEAAHVVQQRAGVSLKGNVGSVGDPYEQHADAVADRVVRGESAESLLDQMAPKGKRGGSPSVQRHTLIPDLPKNMGFKEKAGFFRMQLEIIKYFLKSLSAQDQADQECVALLGLVATHLQNPGQLEEDVLVGMMARTNAFLNLKQPNGIPQAQGQNHNDWKTKFASVAQGARSEIAQLKGDQAVLQSVFGTDHNQSRFRTGTTKKAEQNLDNISKHIEGWEADVNDPARVEYKPASSDFNASNNGHGKRSKLTITNTLFDGSLEAKATMVHEGSHGALGTKDHGYMGASYFLDLPDELRLDNADHYAYAIRKRANASLPQPTTQNTNNLSDSTREKLVHAHKLADYKIMRTWTYASYLKVGSVTDQTRKKYQKTLGINSHKKISDVEKQHAFLIMKAYGRAKGSMKQNSTFVKVSAGNEEDKIKMTIDSKDINLIDVQTKSVEALSQQIINALVGDVAVERFGDLGEALFQGYTHDLGYPLIGKTDEKLYDFLNTD